MSRRRAAGTALLGLALAGCGGSIRVTAPLGRSIAAGPPRRAPVIPTPAPAGDPPAERGGTIPAAAQTAEDAVSPVGVASSTAGGPSAGASALPSGWIVAVSLAVSPSVPPTHAVAELPGAGEDIGTAPSRFPAPALGAAVTVTVRAPHACWAARPSQS